MDQTAQSIGVARLPVGESAGAELDPGHRVAVEHRHVPGWSVEPQLDIVHDELHQEESEADQSTQQPVRNVRVQRRIGHESIVHQPYR